MKTLVMFAKSLKNKALNPPKSQQNLKPQERFHEIFKKKLLQPPPQKNPAKKDEPSWDSGYFAAVYVTI